ncbi:MAG: hypothetical protein RR911_06920 [Oscillospiraceae bacterium]
MKTRKSQIIAIVVLVFLFCFAMAGCMPQDVPSTDTAGFFSGVWHGWIAPISLIASIFTDARIYETNNNGFFYDLGFYMAIISGFGGLAFSRRKSYD